MNPDVKLSDGTLGRRTAIGVFNRAEKRLHLTWGMRMSYQRLIDTVLQSDDIKDKSAEAVGVGLVFITAKGEGVETTFKEICAFSSVSRASAVYATKVLSAVLDVALGSEVDKCGPEDFVVRFAKDLKLNKSTKAVAVNIAIHADAMELAGAETNDCIAAASILMAILATPDFHTISDLARLGNVSEQRLKDLFNQLRPSAKQLFPSESGRFSIAKLPTL
jgi:transcription initiation factor TFIIIB Brf1 subunit/transcription initiation factor TFIIB